MTSQSAKLLPLLILLLTLCTSCRWLHNFNATLEEYPELEELEDDGVSVSRYTPEELAAREASLRAIAKEPYPAYRIDTGDVLHLTFYNHEDLNGDFHVTPDGHIGVPFAGQVRLRGLTLPEAAKALERELQPYLKNLVVGLSPVSMPSQTATIGGCVCHPGVYPVNAGLRLGGLFAMAGSGRTQLFNGQELDMSDFQNSLFIRNGEILPIDFEKAIYRGDPLNNLEIRKGDYIYIASRTDAMVSVIGAVMRPSYLTWNPNMRLTDAITNVGGLTEEAWRYAIIIRGGTANPTFFRVDVDGVLAGLRRNPALHTGDIIYVPRDAISYYNVFIRKLLPTAQLINAVTSPWYMYDRIQD